MEPYDMSLKGLVCTNCKRKAIAISKCETGVKTIPYVIVPLCSQECYEKYWKIPISNLISDGDGKVPSPDTMLRLGTLTTSQTSLLPFSDATDPLNKKLVPQLSGPIVDGNPSSRQQQQQPTLPSQPQAIEEGEDENNDVIFVKPGINLSTHEFTKDEMGRAGWTILAAFAANYPDEPTEEEKANMKKFLDGFFSSYPCRMCREHFKPIYAANPADLTSGTTLRLTICTYHNLVNNALGKPLMPCSYIGEQMSSFVCKE